MMTDREFFSLLYKQFRDTGDWPRIAAVQVHLRKVGNVDRVAAQFGSENVICEDFTDGVCYLTLKGLEQCAEAADDVDNYLAVVRLLASSYIKDGPCDITSATVQSELGLAGIPLRRVFEVARREHDIWAHCNQSVDGLAFSFRPARTIVFFEDVHSLADYWTVKDRIAEEDRETNRIKSGPITAWEGAATTGVFRDVSPASVSLFDKKLQRLVESDLRELEVVLEAGAWKAAAVLAGSCVEAVLLDLWKRHEGDALKRFGRRWPDDIRAYEMAEAAEEKGFLTRDHRELATTIRRWRNLIHPAAAIEGSHPRREIAEALVAVLRLLLADVAVKKSSL